MVSRYSVSGKNCSPRYINTYMHACMDSGVATATAAAAAAARVSTSKAVWSLDLLRCSCAGTSTDQMPALYRRRCNHMKGCKVGESLSQSLNP
jgi:hypothetical protein